MCVLWSECKQRISVVLLTQNMHAQTWFMFRSKHAHASWYSPKWCQGDVEEKNYCIIFVFLVHKKYSRSFIQLRLNHWCHMDYFNDVLKLHFCALIVVPLLSLKSQKALRFHQKYLNLCSEDERRSYRFGTTWGWVINDSIYIFGWTIPLKLSFWWHPFTAEDPWVSKWCNDTFLQIYSNKKKWSRPWTAFLG